MIDQNNHIVLIDYDRLIEEGSNLDDKEHTLDFSSLFVAPEVNQNIISYSCDIYSIGKMMYYIICENLPTNEMEPNEFGQHQKIFEMSQRCINPKPDKRPTISELIFEFYFHYFHQIKDKDLYLIFSKERIRKFYLQLFLPFYFCCFIPSVYMTIPHLNYEIGCIYFNGKYMQKDVHKSIYYFTISAEQNHPKSQLILGSFYYSGIYIQRDINKALHYLTLAANQNLTEANYCLGVIYFERKYNDVYINKSLKYLNLASSQNYKEASYKLFLIYLNGIHVSKNINKALYYGTLAANQNHAESQNCLGKLYYFGIDVLRDIGKAIFYFEKAANQNHADAQYWLGFIYYSDNTKNYNLSKSMGYLWLASNQNHPQAQLLLGNIYYNKRELELAIEYYTKAANQNLPEALNNLGSVYHEFLNDIDKAIKYYLLAAQFNQKDAQYNLGFIYLNDKDKRDIEKGIHYLSLAARKNHQQAQIQLGTLFSEGRKVVPDIERAINYLLTPAKQNNPEAQYLLGMIYLENITDQNSINKAVYFLTQSSINSYNESYFPLGFLYHEGKCVKRDIKKALEYYRDASNTDDTFAKNNFAIIYKNGFGDEMPPNVSRAIQLLDEIQFDYVSSFNLANLYFFHFPNDENIDKAIELLVDSANIFNPSMELLCIVLIHKHGFEFDKINEEVVKYSEDPDKMISKIISLIIDLNMDDSKVYAKYLKFYQDIDYVYDYNYNTIPLKDLMKQEIQSPVMSEKSKIDISSLFYEGLGKELISS